MQRFLKAFLAIVCVFALAACGNKDENGFVKYDRPSEVDSDELQFAPPQAGDTIAVFDTSAGEIRCVLYPALAPMAVENFAALAQQGHYNGQAFNRVVRDFMVQAGDEASGATIWNNNAYPLERTDKLHHYAGALCMATVGGSGENRSQFYIVQAPADSVSKALAEQYKEQGMREAVAKAYRFAGGVPYLDNTATVFGQVYEGMHTVDIIAQTPCGEDGIPLEPVLIHSITILSFTP